MAVLSLLFLFYAFLGLGGANLAQYAFGVLLPGWWQAIQSFMLFV